MSEVDMRNESNKALATILKVAGSFARREIHWTDKQDSLCVDYAWKLKGAHDSLQIEITTLRAENERLKEEGSLWAALAEVLREDYHLAATIAVEALTAAGFTVDST